MVLRAVMQTIALKVEQTILFDRFYKNIILEKIPGTHNRETRKSDHRYIKTSVVLNKLEHGSGYWKLNISHLENQEDIKCINNIFKTLENSLDPISKWGIFKFRTRDFSINFAKH